MMDGAEQEPPPAQSRPSDFWQIWREIQSYAAYYFAAQMDRARLVVRNVLVLALLAIAIVLIGGTIVVMAAVLLCTGIAGGLGRLFGGSFWLGDLVTGLSVFVVIGIGGYSFVKRLAKTSRRQMLNAYEQRKAQQRRDFGADVHDRAEENRSTRSEAQFLQQQTQDAKAALIQTIDRAKATVKTNLTDKVDPLKLTRSHPLVAVGSAALLGFVAAIVTIPSKEELELRRLAKIHRALHPDPVPPPSSPTSNNGSPENPPTSIWAIVLHELISILKPVLMAAVTAGVEAISKKPTAPADNGQQPPTGCVKVSRKDHGSRFASSRTAAGNGSDQMSEPLAPRF